MNPAGTTIPQKRRLALAAALAATLGLTLWQSLPPEEEPAVPALPARRAAGTAGSAGGAAALERLRIDRPAAAEGGEIRDLFASRSGFVPPPPPPAASAEMPALPFAYFGKLIENGRVTVYLAGQERNFAVREGDVIDGVYKVVRIAPPLMTLVYLPSRRKLALDIGGRQ